MAVATNVLVTLPIRNRSLVWGSAPVSRFAEPWALTYSPCPGADTTTKTPGRFLSCITPAIVLSNSCKLATEKRSSPLIVSSVVDCADWDSCCVVSEEDCCSPLLPPPPQPSSSGQSVSAAMNATNTKRPTLQGRIPFPSLVKQHLPAKV